MKRFTAHIRLWFLGGYTLLMLLFLNSCGADVSPESFYTEEKLLISDYLENHKDKFSDLLQVLDITGLKATLNAYGHYTFFAPDNDAFEAFIKENGYTSISDFSKDYLVTLVKFHLLNKAMQTSYFPNGVLSDTTYSGDNLVFSFEEGGLSSIYVNGEAKILDRDIKVSNGYIDEIDQVLKPVVLSIYDQIASETRFSIFSKALETTGLKDTLSIINLQLKKNVNIRTRFTVFCESDEVFGDAGIHSYEDLVAKYSGSPDLTNPSNGLHVFMAYHCLPGLYYLNQLDSFNYPTLATNKLVHITKSDNILLNSHTVVEGGDTTEVSSGVLKDEANISAKNGVYHPIDKVLEPYDPEPAYFMFDLTSYQGIAVGNTYSQEDLNYINGISCENTGLYYRMSILDEDSSYLETTSSSLGWIVEFTLPPITKGTYKVMLHWVSNNDRCTSVQAFWDGDILGSDFSMERQKRPPMTPPEWLYDFRVADVIGTVVLSTTTSHTIRFVGLTSGYGEFDYLTFWPQ